jgi:hypothetical protein
MVSLVLELEGRLLLGGELHGDGDTGNSSAGIPKGSPVRGLRSNGSSSPARGASLVAQRVDGSGPSPFTNGLEREASIFRRGRGVSS